MKRVTSTQATRQFSDLLDHVEHRGETFVVVRRGRTVARISPEIEEPNGKSVKELLRTAPAGTAWENDIREASELLEDRVHSWND